MFKKLLTYDTELLIFLNNLGSSYQDTFWYYITKIWFWVPLYIFFIFMIIKRYTKQEALRILYTFLSLLAVTLSLTYYVKVYVLRSRPVNNKEIFESLRIMIQPIDYSFFSGHACNSFAITTFFYLFMRRKMKNAWVFYLWPILFSYSRLYFAVHFPSDVLVGALVGIATAITSYNLYKKFSPKITRDDLEVESDS